MISVDGSQGNNTGTANITANTVTILYLEY